MKQARTIKDMCHEITLFCRAVYAVLMFSAPGMFNQIIRWHPVLKKKRIGLSGKSRKMPVTLYTREKQKTRPVFIFIAGTRSFIMKSRQLHHLAKVLAVIGYHVILVDDAQNKGTKIARPKPDYLRDLINVVCQDELFDEERIVLAGSDFSSRFIFTLMNDSEMVDKICCMVFLSPVVDISALAKFAYTGRIKFRNRWIQRSSSASLRLLYLLNMVESYIGAEKQEKISFVFEKLMENRVAEAMEITQNLDPETRNLILSVYRNELTEEDVRDITNIDNRDLEKMFSSTVPETDLELPVFIIQSILDKDVDCSQGHRLINSLNSSAGAYLHLTDFITPDGTRKFYANPARWVWGAFRLTKALTRIFTRLYSVKNNPYNPTKSAIRTID